jgi:ubiquinone/menaquinone biosynthesis C-methylase UbiE
VTGRNTHPFADRWNHNSHHYPLIRHTIEGARKVLDVGCGEGTFCRFAEEPGRVVVGLDADLAVLPAPASSLSFVGGSAESLPFASDAFDAVTMTMVLHHLHLEPALSEVVRVLEPGGRLAVLGYGRFSGWRDAPDELRDVLANRWHSRDKAPWDPETAHAPPSQTWAQAERSLRTLLPGCRYRRLRLWRYLVTWRKPPLPV